MRLSETNRAALEAAYEETLCDVARLRSDSDDAQWQLKKLDTLHKMRMSEEEAEAKAVEREQQKSSDKIRYAIDTGVKICGVVLPSVVTIGFGLVALEFERTGSLGSRAAQWVSSIERLFNVKK